MAKCWDCILSLFKIKITDSEVQLENLKALFETEDIANIDDLIDAIKVLLERKKVQKHKKDNPSTSSESASTTEKPPIWTSCIKIGASFLTFVNDRMEEIGKKADFVQSDGERLQVVSKVLEEVGNTHWTVAGLSIVGYLLSKIDEMADNEDKCFKLLQHMFELARHIKNAKHLLRQEDEMLRNALVLLVDGSILCASQLHSKKLFRFFKSSLNSQKLKRLRSDIDHCTSRLILASQTAMHRQLPEIVPIKQPDYPAEAVGIEERRKQVEDLLHMAPTDESFRAVVIYGIGGIGKTYLANAVYAKLKLNGYNHTRVVMDIDPHKNNIKKMQEQILKDVFPMYNSGREINLRDTQEGKEFLKRAFQEADKPVFLFIDNALQAEDLGALLPEGLRRVGKHIRLLITTRNLSTTNMIKRDHRYKYLVKHLQNSDAIKILCEETKNLDHIKDDVERILRICNGVPLVLKIVGAHLENQGYRADKCSEILNALQKGEAIKEGNLSECMVNFVFDKFENFTQEAFLDICSILHGMNVKDRRNLEYAVGSDALKTLEDAALITFEKDQHNLELIEENVEILVVHDLILAKGQNMARSTRIRDIQSFEAAVKEERLEKIKGIELRSDVDRSPYEFKEAHLDSMRNSLRILVLGRRISVSATSVIRFPELRFLELDDNIPFVPFHLEVLENLAVYKGPLPNEGFNIHKSLRAITATVNVECTNWEESKPMQVDPNSSLEELNLTLLHSMMTLPEELQNFTALKILGLRWKMDELPEVIYRLPSLTTLSLVNCAWKCLPPSFAKLTTLTHLALNCCQLQELPSTFVELKSLRYLSLESCSSLNKFPSTFWQLTALEILKLRECSSLEEITGIGQLQRLKCLYVENCPKLSRDFSPTLDDSQIEDEEESEGEEENNGFILLWN